MNIVESKLYSFEEMIPYINTYACNHLRCMDEVNKVKNEHSNIQKTKKGVKETNKDVKKDVKVKVYTSSETFFIHPKETRDIFFWYFFIMKHGYEKYEFHKYKKDVEYDEKYKTIERIKDVAKQEPYKTMLRKSKLKAATIINDIASNESMTLSSFIGMCIIHDIPLILTTSTYYVCYIEEKEEEGGDGDEKINIQDHLGFVIDIQGTLHIQDEEETKYRQPKSRMYYEKKSLSNVQETRMLGKHIYKPLNSMAQYKMNELEDMADVLDIEIKSKMKKKDIYNEIENKLQSASLK